MRLFPSAGDQAIAELVGRMKAEKQAGAAIGKSRRSGGRGRTKRRVRQRK
jgi:hypothetical protein